MAARMVDFNALPKQVRERFIACAQQLTHPIPLVSSLAPYAGAFIGWSILASTSAGVACALLRMEFGRDLQKPAFIAIYAALAGLVVLSILAMFRRATLKKALPFPPGRYLFPLDFVDARDRVLRMIPMATLVDFRGVHQYTNGVYNGTTLTFTFEGGLKEAFVISGKDLAELTLARLRSSQAQANKAVDERDLETLWTLDPFLEVRLEDGWSAPAPPTPAEVDGPAAHALAPIFKWSRMWLVAGLVGIAIGAPALLVRNRLCDDRMFARAEEEGGEDAFEGYVSAGGRRADEVRLNQLPRAALADALRKGSVTAIRTMLDKYRKSVVEDDARAAIHRLFVKTLGEFRTEAADADPRLLPFMERLLAHLEKNETSAVEARFHSPSSESLEGVDALLAAKGADLVNVKGPIARVASHFDDAHARPREQDIVKGLQGGFAAVFPADIMALKEGKRVVVQQSAVDAGLGPGAKGGLPTRSPGREPPPSGPKPKLPKVPRLSKSAEPAAPPAPSSPADIADVKVPTLEIQYSVGWSGDVYSEEKGGRHFVGIVVRFAVKMQIPGEKETFDFDLAVEPPDHFTVDYTTGSLGDIGVPGLEAGPTEGKVYDVMAERAFDQLSTKLRGVFFRRGSKAYGGGDAPEDHDAPGEPSGNAADDDAPAKPAHTRTRL